MFPNNEGLFGVWNPPNTDAVGCLFSSAFCPKPKDVAPVLPAVADAFCPNEANPPPVVAPPNKGFGGSFVVAGLPNNDPLEFVFPNAPPPNRDPAGLSPDWFGVLDIVAVWILDVRTSARIDGGLARVFNSVDEGPPTVRSVSSYLHRHSTRNMSSSHLNVATSSRKCLELYNASERN